MLNNALTLAISFFVSLLLAEGALRLLLDPVDYLMATPTPDPVLNHRIPPNKSGHDAWGFRNAEVPDNADILAVGDSMTYGVMARSSESWPAQLQEITEKTVYSAALGGYGPLHYLHLLRTYGEKLSPDQVVVMIYPGNDLMDAYNLAHSNENWADYQVSEAVALDPNLFVSTAPPPSLSKRARNWFAHHSMLYRLVTQSPVFDWVRRTEVLDAGTGAITVEHIGQLTVLDPARVLAIADIDDPRIADAVEISGRAFKEMKGWCDSRNIAIHATIMPVRERVFYPFLGENLAAEQLEKMNQLIDSLERIEDALLGELQTAGIGVTVLRPDMEDALSKANIYPPTDGHPNALGYHVAAQRIATALEASAKIGN